MLGTLDNTGIRHEIIPALDELTAYFTPVEYTESKLKSTTTESMESMCREMIEEMIENDNGDDIGYSRPMGQNAEVKSVIRTHNHKNAYEREPVIINKNSDQMITSDNTSYARESITTNKSYQRKEENGMSENKKLNPHKHARKNHTCGKIKKQDSYKNDTLNKNIHQRETSPKKKFW